MLSDQLSILAEANRRRLLIALADRNPRSIDSDGYVGGPDMSDPNVATAMYHVHLPKLEAAGFIDWDREENVVTRGPKFEEIRPLVDLLDSHREELPGGAV